MARRLARRKRSNCLSAREAHFLRQINRGFSDSWWEHYHELVRKRRESELDADQHRELIKLSDQIERREGKRLQALVQLAKLKKIPLAKLMLELGLPGHSDG